MMADFLARSGSTEQAINQMAEAGFLLNETGERWCEAEIVRMEAVILARTGDLASARSKHERSLSIARGQAARWWELRTATSLAKLLEPADRGEMIEIVRQLLGKIRADHSYWDTEQALSVVQS
jgi:predicted ATPase